jgi:tetratricopeptide (TPR) repeat protein
LGKRLHSTLAILPLAQALFHEGELDDALRYINEAIEIEQTSDEPDIEEIVRYEVILRDIVSALGETDVAAEITRRHESIREIAEL